MKENIKGYLLYLTFHHKKKKSEGSLSDIKKDVSKFEKNVKEHILDARPDVSFHSPFQSVKNTITDCIKEGYISSEQGFELLEKQVHSNEYNVRKTYDTSIDLFLEDFYTNKISSPRLHEYYDIYQNGDREDLIHLSSIASIKWNNSNEFHTFYENYDHTKNMKEAEDFSLYDAPGIDSSNFGFSANFLGGTDQISTAPNDTMARFSFQQENYKRPDFSEELAARINWAGDEITDRKTTEFTIDANVLSRNITEVNKQFFDTSEHHHAMRALLYQERSLLKEKQEILNRHMSFSLLKERFQDEFTNPNRYSHFVDRSPSMETLNQVRVTNRSDLALDRLHDVSSEDLSTLNIDEEKVLQYREELGITSSSGGYTIPRQTIDNILNDRMKFLDEDFTKEFKKALEKKSSLHTNVLVFEEPRPGENVDYKLLSTSLKNTFRFDDHEVPKHLTRAVQTRLGSNSSKLVMDAYQRGLISSDQRDFIFYKAKDGTDASRLIARASADVFSKDEKERLAIIAHVESPDFGLKAWDFQSGKTFSLKEFSVQMAKDPISKNFLERVYVADQKVLQNIHEEVQKNIGYNMDPVRQEIQRSISENKTFQVKEKSFLTGKVKVEHLTQDGLFGRQSVGFYDHIKDRTMTGPLKGLEKVNVTPYQMVEKDGVTKFQVSFQKDGPVQVLSLNQKSKIDFMKESVIRGYLSPDLADKYLSENLSTVEIQKRTAEHLATNLLKTKEIPEELKKITFNKQLSINDFESSLGEVSAIKKPLENHLKNQRQEYARVRNLYETSYRGKKDESFSKRPEQKGWMNRFHYQRKSFDKDLLRTAPSQQKEIQAFLKDSMRYGYLTPQMAKDYLNKNYTLEKIQEKTAENITQRLRLDNREEIKQKVQSLGFSNSRTIKDFEQKIGKIPTVQKSLAQYKREHQRSYQEMKNHYYKIFDDSMRYHRQRMGFEKVASLKENAYRQYNKVFLLQKNVLDGTKKRFEKFSADYQLRLSKEEDAFQERVKKSKEQYKVISKKINLTRNIQKNYRKKAIEHHQEKRKDLSYYQEIQELNYIKRFMENDFEVDYKKGRDAYQISIMLNRFNHYNKKDFTTKGIEENLEYSEVMKFRNRFANTRLEIKEKRRSFSESAMRTHWYQVNKKLRLTETAHFIKRHYYRKKQDFVLGAQRDLIVPKAAIKSFMDQVDLSKMHKSRAGLTFRYFKKAAHQTSLRLKYRKNAYLISLNHMKQTVRGFDHFDDFQMIYMTRRERRAYHFLQGLALGEEKLTVINALRKRHYYRKMFGSKFQRIRKRVHMISSWVVFYGVSSLIREGDEYIQDNMRSLRNVRTIVQVERLVRQKGYATIKAPFKYGMRLRSLNRLWNLNKSQHMMKGKKLFVLANFLKKDKKVFRNLRPKTSLLQVGIRVSTLFQSINSYGAETAKAARNIYTTTRVARTSMKGAKKVTKAVVRAPRNIKRAGRAIKGIGKATIAAIQRLIRMLISLVTVVVANIVPIVAAVAVIAALVNFAAILSFFTDMFMVREEYDPATQFYNRVTKLDYDKNKKMNKELKELLKVSRDKYYKAMRVSTRREYNNLGFQSIEVPYVEKMVIEEPFRLNEDPTLVRTDAIRTLYYLETLYGTDNLEQFTSYDVEMTDKVETPADVYQDPTLGFRFLDKNELTDDEIKDEIRGKTGQIRGDYSYTIGEEDIKATNRVGTIYRDPVSQLKKMHDEMHHIAFSEIVRLRSLTISSDTERFGQIHIYGRKTGSEPFDNWFNPTYVNKTTSFGENIANLHKNDTGIDKLALLEGGEDRISTLDDRMNGFFYEYENPLGYEEESGEGYSWIRRNPKEYYSITDGEMLVNEKNQYDFPTTYIRRRYGYEGDQDTNAIWKNIKGIFTKNDADDDKNVNTVIDVAVSNGKTTPHTDEESGEEVQVVEGTKVYAPMGGKVEVASNSFSDSSESFSETNRIGGEYIIIKDVLKKHAFEGSVSGSEDEDEITEKEDATEDQDLENEEDLEETEENQDEMMMMMIGGLDKVSMEAIKEKITETDNEYMIDEGDLLGTIKLTERDQPKPRFPFQGTGNTQGLNALSESSNDPGSPVYRTNLSAREWEQVIQSISGGNSRLLPSNTGALSHGFFDALADIEQRVGINAMFLLGIIQQENSGVTSNFPQSARTAREKNNLFSVNAIDSNPSGNADTYLNYQDSLISAASLLSRRYLDPSKPGHFKSQYGITVRGVAETYCSTSESWAAGVSSFMGRLHSTIQSLGFGGKHASGYVASSSSTGSSYNPSKLNIPNVPSAGAPTTGDAIEGAQEPDRTTDGVQENLRPQEYKELRVIPFYPTEEKRTISSGKEIRKGVILANPSTIAKTLTVKMDGYGYGVVEEVSDSVGAGEIFIGFNSKEEAEQFGQKTLRVAIYPEGFLMPNEDTAGSRGERKKKEEVERTPERISDIDNYESILYMNMFYQYTPDKDESKIMKLIHGRIRRAYLNPAMRMASGPIDQTNAQSYMLETGWAQLKNQFEEYMDGTGKVDTTAGFMGGTGFNGTLGASIGFDPQMKQFIHHPKVIPGSKRQLTLMWAATHQGIPYQLSACHGGWNCSYRGIDCSAFVSNALYHAGVPLRSVFNTRNFMSDVHPKVKITDRSQLIPGDIVLMYNGAIGHIEIFLGDMPAQRKYLTVGSRGPTGSPSSKGTIGYSTSGYDTYLWRLGDHDTMASERLVYQYINEIRKHDPSFTIPGYGSSIDGPTLMD